VAGDPPVEFETVASLEKRWLLPAAFLLRGTQCNSYERLTVFTLLAWEYPAESLVVPAVVMDIRDKAAVNADYALTIADVRTWEQQHGLVPAGSVVLLYTGWLDLWFDRYAFLNPDAEGRTTFSGLWL